MPTWLTCADAPTLLHEARALLTADARAGDLLDRIDLPPPTSLAAPCRLGEHIGRYRILENLGSGGMGVVYKALDTRLDRFVALKLLPPHLLGDPLAGQRLMVEAKAASRLDHPTICTVYELGETADDRIYIVMAYCEGEGLEQRLTRGPLDAASAVHIACQVAEGLAVAHAADILHRDIKPSNLIVTPDNRVKIVDFGVAKMAGVDLTGTGHRLGTIGYMSPEQLRAEDVDGRTDQWGVGAILYEMLTGLRAFPGDHLPEIMYAIIHTRPRPLRSVLPDLPEALGAIVARALEPDPARRFAHMEEFRQSLLALQPRLCTVPPEPICLAGSARTPAPTAILGDRRQASVMFVSLHDYAQLATELPPARSQALLGRFLGDVTQAVTTLSGTIAKQYGDTIMAVFGAPLARGNDAQRATHAALAIHAAMATRETVADAAVQVHIGISTGPVVSTPLVTGEGADAITVSGETVNIATRLEDMAQPGETLVDDGHYRLVSEQFEAHASGTLTVRGQCQPIPMWSLDGLRAISVDTRPLAGRRAELRLFQGLLEHCNEASEGEILYLRGEAGIGKTRLGEEFSRLARRQGFRCLTGLNLDFGVGVGENAIDALVRQFLGLAVDADLDTRRRRAREVKDRQQVSTNHKVFLCDLLHLPLEPADKALYNAMTPEHRHRGRQDTLVALLRMASAEGPLLLCVEDLHWADDDTLDCLAALGAAILSEPVILVCTARKETEPLGPGWRASIGDTPFTSVELRPLRTTDARQLADEFPGLESAYVERCIRRAEGNPLFLAQLLRAPDGIDDDTLPPSLHNLVLSQLDRLPEADRQALRAAAVIGQRFSEALVRHLVDDPHYPCKQLVEHGLVRPKNGDYLFSHALIQDGIYLSLLKVARRDLHHRAAQWFAPTDPLRQAEHLERAEDPAAADAYYMAAETEARGFHCERARTLVQRGLRMTPEHPGLTVLLGDIQRGMGEVDDARSHYQAVLALPADNPLYCRAWLGLAECADLSDDFSTALAALGQAQTLVESDDDRDDLLALARIHYLRGNLYFPRGDIEACLAQQQLAQDYARQAGCAEYEARALSGLGDAHYAAGRMLSACTVFERCLTLCETHSLGQVEAANRFMLGTVRIYRNEADAALRDALASAELAVRVGDIRAEIVSRLTAGWIFIDRAETAAAREQAETALQLANDLGAGRFQAFLQESLARILLAEGEKTAAQALARQALATSREMGMSFIGPWILGTLALATDDEPTRDAALEEGETLLREGCVGHNYYRFYRAAMEASLAREAWDEAERYADLLADYTRDEAPPWALFFIRYTRALAAVGRAGLTAAQRSELLSLRSEAREAGLITSIPAIEARLTV
ncbi:MAG: protein kinase [Gammaproteobacteria bacterium]|nr:protein kinase [Gammaproteobacteria bacterium]